MKKKIKVILIRDYLNIGNKGKVIDTSSGYALNYLIPNKIAEVATKNKIRHLRMIEEINKNQIKANEIANNQIKKQLESTQKISINRKTGENYYIFGRIIEKDIINYIFKYMGIKLKKRQIEIPGIKKLGVFETKVQISTNNSLKVKLQLNIIPTNI